MIRLVSSFKLKTKYLYLSYIWWLTRAGYKEPPADTCLPLLDSRWLYIFLNRWLSCDKICKSLRSLSDRKRAIYWGKYEANESPKVANMYYEIRTWWPIGVCWLSLSMTYWTNGCLFFFFPQHCKCNAMKVVWFVDNKILWVPWTTVLLMSRQPKRK